MWCLPISQNGTLSSCYYYNHYQFLLRFGIKFHWISLKDYYTDHMVRQLFLFWLIECLPMPLAAGSLKNPSNGANMPISYIFLILILLLELPIYSLIAFSSYMDYQHPLFVIGIQHLIVLSRGSCSIWMGPHLISVQAIICKQMGKMRLSIAY